MEVLCHDVVELILERVPVKSLLRFKSVSKQWRSMIESNSFQLIHRKQSRVPDVLFHSYPSYDGESDDDDTEDIPSSASSSCSLDDIDGDDDYIKYISSSPVTIVKFPVRWWFRCSESCDGLLCFYNGYKSITVFNPTTRWHRTLPPSNLQQQHLDDYQSIVINPTDTRHPTFQEQRRYKFGNRINKFGFATLGFGKDKFNGTYKSVWLYNTQEFDSSKAWRSYVTTCEVFDFSINAWRCVTLASPYEIIAYVKPVNIDGSLHWLTRNGFETEVLSFDLHTETFQVIAKAPSDKAERYHYKICNLNNRLCVSEVNWSKQVIWLFDSGSKKWDRIHSIDLKMTYSWFRREINWNSEDGIGPLELLAVLEEKNTKTKVMYSIDSYEEPCRHFVIYDCQTESYDLAFTFKPFGGWDPVCYFQSFISI